MTAQRFLAADRSVLPRRLCAPPRHATIVPSAGRNDSIGVHLEDLCKALGTPQPIFSAPIACSAGHVMGRPLGAGPPRRHVRSRGSPGKGDRNSEDLVGATTRLGLKARKL